MSVWEPRSNSSIGCGRGKITARALTHAGNASVFGDRAVDGPLVRDHGAPTSGSARDGEQLEPGALQSFERAERSRHEPSVVEQRVVQIEEQAAQRARLVARERMRGTHQEFVAICATTVLRYKPSGKAAGTG